MSNPTTLAPLLLPHESLAVLPAPVPTAEQVFQEYAPRVYRLTLRLLGNEAEAEHVASAVLLQAMREFDGGWDKSWLDRITPNAARRRHKAQPGETEPVQQGLVSELARATALLPAMYREVLVLADSEGLSTAAVSQQLGLSLAEVTTRLHHARLLLREVLGTSTT